MCISGNCNSGYGVFGDMDGGYEGTWRNGLYQGTGKVHYRNGDKYVGSFNLGLFDGEGIYTTAMGESRSGIWKKGKYLGTETEIKERKQKKEAKRIANLERIRLLEEEKVYLKKKAIKEEADRELMARKQKCIRYGFKDDTDGMGMCLIELDKLDILKEESINKQQMNDQIDFGSLYLQKLSKADEQLAAKSKADGQALLLSDARAKANEEARAKANEVALEQRRADIKRQNNQVDWGAFARAAGAVFNAPGAFGNPERVRICNFKSWDGAIISGDCKESSIRIGSETYRKF